MRPSQRIAAPRELTVAEARAAVAAAVQDARSSPGPGGGITSEHMTRVIEALTQFVHVRYPVFGLEVVRCVAAQVVIHIQARLHVQVAAIDLRALDDPLEDALMTVAQDTVLDVIGPSLGIPEILPLEECHSVVAVLGDGVSPADVRRVMRDLVQDRRREEVLVLQALLDLVEEAHGLLPSDAAVARRASVPQEMIAEALYEIKTRLGDLS